MTFLFRRAARRAQQVATGRVAFDDSRDFIREQISDAGEPLPALTLVAPRPSYVHRSRVDVSSLIDSLQADLDLQVFRKNRRKALAPALSRAFPRTYPRLFAGKSVGKFGATHQRVKASFAEFNRLRLDPRTAVCVRRRTRREVLFANRVAGGRGMRSYRRNLTSQWSC